ncbi:hypothetical protein [Rhodohalobacter halophilus]|uniref:hypothetical protein n=1 Tax=Rhodohalobacter halophilus TaxID=1812810 RepID=UPI00083FA91A|nr:hypothetical protein [Rhodohalobacter halophilus]
MITLSETLSKILKCEITGKTDLVNLVDEISKGSKERLQSMKFEIEDYINNQSFSYKLGIMRKYWPDVNDKIYHKRALDGLANLKKFVKIVELKLDTYQDPRLKYYSENYWDTAFKIYRDDQISWKSVYKKMIAEMESLGIEKRHTSFDSFDSARKRYQREQRSSN